MATLGWSGISMHPNDAGRAHSENSPHSSSGFPAMSRSVRVNSQRPRKALGHVRYFGCSDLFAGACGALVLEGAIDGSYMLHLE